MASQPWSGTRLLDIDVDPFGGPGAFVAANGLAGGPVQYGKDGQAVTVQDPVSGGGGDAGAGRQPQRADAVFAPLTDDLFLNGDGRAQRLVVWATGAVLHACRAVCSAAAGPPGRGGVADLETFCGPRSGQPSSMTFQETSLASIP